MSAIAEDLIPGLFTQAISISLAKALAEAASGYANQGDIYFVASYAVQEKTGFHFIEPYPSPDEAEARAEELGAGYAAFGPFETMSYSPASAQMTVQSVDVTVVAPAGSVVDPLSPAVESFDIAGTQYDSLFYSIEAVEKFVLPYYCELYGPAFAQRVKDAYTSSPVALMAHLPWSEYTMVSENTAGVARAAVGRDRKWLPAVLDDSRSWKTIYPWAHEVEAAAGEES